jgi:hypothetical protein
LITKSQLTEEATESALSKVGYGRALFQLTEDGLGIRPIGASADRGEQYILNNLLFLGFNYQEIDSAYEFSKKPADSAKMKLFLDAWNRAN